MVRTLRTTRAARQAAKERQGNAGSVLPARNRVGGGAGSSSSTPPVSAVDASYTSKGSWDRLSKTGSSMWENLKQSATDEGRTVLGAAGQHAIRGAAWGAVGGGTIEAAQGGSFWDGAKQGGFNGAVGWTGYRMGMRATGAKSMNPFAGKNEGLISSASTMYRAGSADGAVSKQAQAILRPMQVESINKAMMRRKKDS